ncbi:cupin domain-containing protein [Catenuloplanes sp. NPDC051500]|uniref:cupin domain-containing protein n=1 Tax=Catenuloplanes sp. NPDC051500 TaxID=3363959 RepID=UPI00379C8BE9
MIQKTSVGTVAKSLTEYWSQRVVAEANGNLFKVAKGLGATSWHAHHDQEETFLVLDGALTVQLRDGDVHLEAGDLLVIPRGVEHCPLASEDVFLLLIGPDVTSTAAGGKPAWSVEGGRPTPG